MIDGDELFKFILQSLGDNFTKLMDKKGAFNIEDLTEAFVDKCIEDKNEAMIEYLKEQYPEKFI